MNPKTKPDDLATAVPSGVDFTLGENTPAHPIYSKGGLTKREYFAAMALQGYCSQSDIISGGVIPRITDTATDAVRMADALIAALNKEAA